MPINQGQESNGTRLTGFTAKNNSLPRRADAVTDGNRVDEVLANVPETAGGFFVVPKVVE